MRKSAIVLIGILFFVVSVKAQVSEKEYKVLKAFYEKMGGKSWTNSSGWDFSKSANDVKGFNKKDSTGWFGLTVRNGKIERINLYKNNLSGMIPEELYTLDGLNYLSLAKNSITGTISPKIGQMASLSFLDLGANHLTGAIPDEICKIGVNAVTSSSSEKKKGTELSINLSRNKLTGVLPTGLSQMPLWSKPNIGIKIDLSSNQLTGNVPVELEKINNLVLLRLDRNKFEGNVPKIEPEK
jgi:Leucine-rich repeat (LRR) protein